MSYIENIALNYFLFYTEVIFISYLGLKYVFILKRSTLFIIGARKSNCKQQVGISNAYRLSHMCRLQMIKLKHQYKNRKTKLTVNFKNS